MHGSWLNGWRLTALAGLGVAAMAAAAIAPAAASAVHVLVMASPRM